METIGLVYFYNITGQSILAQRDYPDGMYNDENDALKQKQVRTYGLSMDRLCEMNALMREVFCVYCRYFGRQNLSHF